MLAVASITLSPALADHGTEPDWPTDGTRIFYADDPETDERGNTEFASAANFTDLYYPNATPRLSVGGHTLAEYRRQQLLSVERNREDSKYLPSSEPRDGPASVIEDAHVTFLGVVGGARPMLADGEYPLYVQPEGQVLNYLDYRVDEGDLPDERTKELGSNKTRTWKNYEIVGDETGVEERTVTIDGQQVGTDSGRPGARIIDYAGASGDGTVTLKIRATIEVTIGYDVVTKENDSVVDRDERTDTVDELTVTDTVEVEVLDDQQLQASQRLVRFEGGGPSELFVTFQGPSTLADRQLWSRIVFSDRQVVINHWGVYSATRYAHGQVSTNEGTKRFGFPNVLSMRFTSSRQANRHMIEGGADSEMTVVEETNYTTEPAELAEGVNLSPSRATFKRSIRVVGLGEATRVEGLMGDDVSLSSSSSVTVQRAELTVEQVNDTTLEVRLYDPDTGDGVGGRTLYLAGARVDSVETGSDGTVEVTRTARRIRVRFPGDDWRSDVASGSVDPPYYQSTGYSEVFVGLSGLQESLIEFGWSLLLATPFAIGYLWFRDWRV